MTSDPLTIGALVASALAMAGEAGLKGAVGEAIKDIYKTLKDKVARLAGGDVDALEKTPTSKPRQDVVAEIINAQQPPPEDAAELRLLAERLIAALRSAGSSDHGRSDLPASRSSNTMVMGGTAAVAGYNEVHGIQQIIIPGPPTKKAQG
jgi:hypothetical protein